MEIAGIRNSYNNNIYASQKNEVAKQAETKETSSIPTGRAKSTANNDVSDYYSYLAKKYDCVKNGNVAISGTYLKECVKNTDKAKELEENLAFYKESYKRGYESAKANARAIGARVTNYSESWSIDSTGNVVMQASTTVVSDTKGWRELKEERDERIKEKREQEEKEKKLKEKKEERQEHLNRAKEEAYYPKFDMNI